MFDHLGLKNLVQDWLQQGSYDSVPMEQLMDLLIIDLTLKGSRRQYVGWFDWSCFQPGKT